jgi:Bacteriophage CI repressor helix-turn-helix domain.
MPSSDFASQYRRICEAAACRTQIELASILKIKQSSISDAKRRKAIPSDWLITLLEKNA